MDEQRPPLVRRSAPDVLRDSNSRPGALDLVHAQRGRRHAVHPGKGGPPVTRMKSSPAASETNEPSGASVRRFVQTSTQLLQHSLTRPFQHVEDLLELLGASVVGIGHIARALGVPLAQQVHLGAGAHGA